MSYKTKSDFNHPTILQLVKLNSSPDSLYRMQWPAENLARQRPNWRIINLDAFADERYQWALDSDLLVIYQSRDIDLIPIIKKRKSQGKKTIFEVSDNFYCPQPWAPVSRQWNSPLLWQDYEAFMREVDSIQVSSHGLKNLLTSIRQEQDIQVIPNQIHFQIPEFNKSLNSQGQVIRIGWAGSSGHAADILAISKGILNILHLNEQAEMHIMASQEIKAIIKTQVPHDRLFFTPIGDIESYFNFLKTLDIGIIPLIENDYNLCRSDLKPLEYSAFGILPIIQKIDTYKDFSSQTGAPNFTSTEDLSAQINHYIKNPALRIYLALKCHEYVKKNNVAAKNTLRAEYYEKLLPKENYKFSIDLNSGYQFIEGTQSRILPRQILLKEANSLIEKGELAKAASKLEQELEINTFLADAALLELRTLASLNAKNLQDKFLKYIDSHPKDLRLIFWGFEQNLLSDKKSEWLRVIDLLKTNKIYSNFYEKEAINSLIKSIESKSIDIDLFTLIAENLVDIYPHSLILRKALCEKLVEFRKLDNLLRHFKFLQATHRTLEDLGIKLEGINSAYYELWIQALEK